MCFHCLVSVIVIWPFKRNYAKRMVFNLYRVIDKVKSSIVVFTPRTDVNIVPPLHFKSRAIRESPRSVFAAAREDDFVEGGEPARASPTRPRSRRSGTIRTADAIATDFCLPLVPLAPPGMHRGSHTWAAWRHETKRGSEARTFDIAFLRGPGPPQRGVGSINRISGRSLIIHLCTPVRRMANPRKSRIFSLSKGPRENLISAPWRPSFSSYPWNVVSCCGRITDLSHERSRRLFHPTLLRGDCRNRIPSRRKKIAAREEKNGA